MLKAGINSFIADSCQRPRKKKEAIYARSTEQKIKGIASSLRGVDEVQARWGTAYCWLGLKS